LVKKQLQKAIQGAVRTGLEYIDGQLVGVRDRTREAKACEDSSRTQVLPEMFQRKKEETASARSKAGDKHAQFQMVSKRDSAILPDAGHPSGWINCTQECSDAAGSGEAWRSEVFTIV